MKVPGLNIRDFENARLKDLEVKKNNQFLGTKQFGTLEYAMYLQRRYDQ